DLVIDEGFRALPLDPSLGPDKLGSKAGFDLTWPFGTGGAFDRQVPAPPRYDGRRFASIQAALQDGPKLFMELMDAVGSRDGREIVRAMEEMRLSGSLDRDAEGRYRLKSAG